MFVAGVWATPEIVESWTAAGLKDSKQMKRKDRDAMAERIKAEAIHYNITEISPEAIDNNNIDDLEFRAVSSIVSSFKFKKAFLDCPGNPTVWKLSLMLSRNSYCFDAAEFIVEHKADETYPITAAASVVAKNARDKHADNLKLPNGGYSGKELLDFINSEFIRTGKIPEYVRKSWANVDRIVQIAEGQRGFGEWF